MRRTIFAFLSTIMLLSSACVIAVVDSASQGQYWPKNTFRKSLELKPGGAVTLENINGDIEISGWENERVEISAEGSRESPQSAGIHFFDRRFSPPDVRVQSTGDSVRIRTRESRYEGERGVVHYVLNVPHSVNLDSVRNGRGRISISDIYGRSLLDAEEGEVKISNYSGSLDVRLESGAVEAELLDLRPQDSVRIKVERGDIVLLLERDAAAQLIAAAPAGNIFSELELGQALPARKLTAKLGDGQASIELTALQGDIRVRKVEETQ
jgi:DUF4097 and DUF4098 domain-containing protein YvlB